jgi:glycosyltransferase involved in cell wall biosynthesis
VFVARLVDHHKGRLLPEAIARLAPSVRDHIEVHLVGTGFDRLKQELQPWCRVEDHGFVSRKAIGALLQRMDCGVITNCPAYGSQMKLLDYAASGCLVLAPDVVHLKNFFLNRGVLFFTQNDSGSLAERLTALVQGSVPADQMARTLQHHVRKTYTWDAIFERKWATIRALYEQEGSA